MMKEEEIDESFLEVRKIIEESIKTELIPELKSYVRSLFKEELSEPLERKLDNIKEDFEIFMKRSREKLDSSLKKNNEELSKILKCNENTEEYISNMLTAIRQNEYLQAWYPAQKGYPEMKVSGKHPSKLK